MVEPTDAVRAYWIADSMVSKASGAIRFRPAVQRPGAGAEGSVFHNITMFLIPLCLCESGVLANMERMSSVPTRSTRAQDTLWRLAQEQAGVTMSPEAFRHWRERRAYTLDAAAQALERDDFGLNRTGIPESAWV